MKKKKPTGNILVPISSPPNYIDTGFLGLVVVGSDIYIIGGFTNGEPLSRVFVLDCRSHTWHEAPHMCEGINYPSPHVIDGKIYVVGGRGMRTEWKWNQCNWIEVFDLREAFSVPCQEICGIEYLTKTLVIDGKIYIYSGRKGVSYNPKDGTCESAKWMKSMFKGWSCCVINNVLLGYHGEGVFKWYDTKVRKWRNLKGLKEVSEFPIDGNVKLADYGGKMVVLWEEYVLDDDNRLRHTRIWCAEIALERCNNDDEISGKVLWFDVVLETPTRCDEIVGVLAATV